MLRLWYFFRSTIINIATITYATIIPLDFLYLALHGEEDQSLKSFLYSIIWAVCRYPIPDHYSITLEISRDRTTAATSIPCDTRTSNPIECPTGSADPGMYLNRSVNTACNVMVINQTFLKFF